MPPEQTPDHDLLIRIDEKVDYILKTLPDLIADVDALKKWKWQWAGAMALLVLLWNAVSMAAIRALLP